MLRIIKLGGSAITDKKKPLSGREELIKRLAKELLPAYPELILTHGTGAFGHPLVLKYKVHRGYHGKKEELIGISDVKWWVNTLTSKVHRALIDAGIPSFTMFASSFMILEEGKIKEAYLESVKNYLKIGVVPLIPADGPPDLKYGFWIVSGDYLAYYLAKELGVAEVIFGVDVDGLIWDGIVLKEVDKKMLNEILSKMEEGKDVTGGMKGKLKHIYNIVSLGIPVRIVNLLVPDRLKKLLLGEDVLHTLFKP
ncbi:MAG: isopentenyl phosphate kinase [Candidatus Njordarchaeales archaeon]